MLITNRVCDFKDGFEAEARRFSLDGQDYDIDVCLPHSDALDEAVRRWADRGRRASSRPFRQRSRPAAARHRSAEIRAWGLARGYEVRPGGRMSEAVIRAYDAEH